MTIQAWHNLKSILRKNHSCQGNIYSMERKNTTTKYSSLFIITQSTLTPYNLVLHPVLIIASAIYV